MYNTFFGFREKPFKLVPNPEYLYLSKSHEIALAHLTYATDQGDGFVVITGEVGTGKTMLCRIFLERIDDKTESAYIFNPNLDALQLLSAICHEFGIETHSETIKDLQDELNDYLIKKNQAGHKAILLIDEAQNLTIENLEMVRMLSNLETTRSKLLQIILVGQPELGDKLDSFELRQLSQRISLSCHLTPLTGNETKGYIQHRINIASQRPATLFSPGACRLIYRYASGIPRLINIACDRALLCAYSLNRQKVSRPIVQTALKELANRGKEAAKRRPLKMVPLWIALAAGIALATGFFLFGSDLMGKHLRPQSNNAPPQGTAEQPSDTGSGQQPPQTFKIPDKADKSAIAEDRELHPVVDTPKNDTGSEMRIVQPDQVAKESRAVAESQAPALPNAAEVDHAAQTLAKLQDPSLAPLFTDLNAQTSRMDAVAAILALWKQPHPNAAQFPQGAAPENFFDIAARQYGLRLHTVVSDWALVKKLNLPAIVVLKDATGVPIYVTVAQWLDNGHLQLVFGQPAQAMETDFKKVHPYLGNKAYIFWKNAFGFDFIIAQGAHSDAIVALKTLLRKIGYAQIPLIPEFDPQTRKAVRDFQARHNLHPDGLVGPLTKILMINELQPFHIPRLTAAKGTEKGAGS